MVVNEQEWKDMLENSGSSNSQDQPTDSGYDHELDSDASFPTATPLDALSIGHLSATRIRQELPHIDPKFNSLLVLLNRTSAELVSELEVSVHRPLGLTWSGYRLLFVLWIVGELEPTRAAVLTNTSRASVSNLSASFVAQGLVNRRPSEVDGRSIVLSLTSKGRDLVKIAFQQQDTAQRDILSELTCAEREILEILLTKLLLSRSDKNSH